MSEDRLLFSCEDPALWRRIYKSYWRVVELKSMAKGKKPGKLLPLDKWYQDELPKAIASRPQRFLTHPELLKVMEWKLTRGKFRPRLQQLVATNPSETVEKCTKKAFSLLPDIQAAITELSSLKALGPATASVLAAGSPELAAFMADEAVESIPYLKPVQYTAKHYSLYLQRVVERSCSLNEECPVCSSLLGHLTEHRNTKALLSDWPLSSPSIQRTVKRTGHPTRWSSVCGPGLWPVSCSPPCSKSSARRRALRRLWRAAGDQPRGRGPTRLYLPCYCSLFLSTFKE
ncbi:uncharacterized protein [Paramormyrops kingsleyae]|uniref:uncharacterized protein isoform X2 n=1 Tax=Paramormyrops kingsleyae TaxID=1676925 RepID=UPI000CD5D626|nr:uncharacterized protein LOC111841961 isoform X2 [Paramormyrops kingsleyae]